MPTSETRRIRVSVRMRPEGRDTVSAAALRGSARELSTNAQSFASWLGPDASQLQVYNHCGAALVDALFSGYNGCLFAYGQTGSGKTHSMLGRDGGRGKADLDGVIPHVASELFRQVNRQEGDAEKILGARHMSQFEVRATYVEVWKERVYDLLAKDGRRQLEVREGEAGGASGGGAASSSGSSSSSAGAGSGAPRVPRRASRGGGATTSSSSAAHAYGAVEERVSSTKALLKLIAKASARRTTDSTGLNEHSSRSHALLTLIMEHRWREAPAASSEGKEAGSDGKARRGSGTSIGSGRGRSSGSSDADEDEGRHRSRITRLTLVDLAGSESTAEAHAGSADAAGCAINQGLLSLGQVCTALAEGHAHVPYRDSALTRLLQGSLSGRCRTHLLACISGSDSRVWESERTLEFAKRVGGLSTVHARAAAIDVAPAEDPMRGDRDDDSADLHRRAVVIETRKHGDVFARVVGHPRDPLVLWVHGSGPRNSSMQWNDIVLAVARTGRRFYHVAIDCPGYGRSPGDKQTIRSYPGELLSDIVRSLGKRKAFCLTGSSQGACAVLNCALEAPALAHHVAVCHPVGHDVARYSRITQPTLLLFDHEDAGHPISVGFRMRKNLPRPHWYEFRSSADGDYLGRNMATHLLAMFDAEARGTPATPAPDSVAARANDDALPDLTRVAGGVRAWSLAHGREYEDWETPLDATEALTAAGDGTAFSATAAAAADSDGDRDGDEGKDGDGASNAASVSEWMAELDTRTNRVAYVNTRTGERSTVRPAGVHISVRGGGSGGGGARPAASEGKGGDDAAPLFHDDEHVAMVVAKARKDADAARAAELSKRECDRCSLALFADTAVAASGPGDSGSVDGGVGPVTLSKCRHTLCPCCVAECLRWHRTCPQCGTAHDAAACKALDVGLCDALRSDAYADVDAIAAQRARHAALQRDLRSTTLLVLEVGNTAGAAGEPGRVAQNTFVRAVGGLRRGSNGSGSSVPGGLISKVDFNINPGYSKPTATVKTAHRKWGFALERNLAFTFPCFASVHFNEALGVAPLHLPYYTQMKHKLRVLRVVVHLPTGAGGAAPRRRGKVAPVEFDPHAGEGVVRYAAGGTEADIQHFLSPGALAARSDSDSEGDTSSAKFKGNAKDNKKGKGNATHGATRA